MNPNPKTASLAAQINHLHGEVRRLSSESRRSLDGALSAAWQAGRLLAEHKQHLRRTIGRGCWIAWLDAAFAGSRSAAYRYMQLAREVPDPDTLRGLSLRQAYFRLGIATEPKTSAQTCPAKALPEPVVLAQKLLRILRRGKKLNDACLDDLGRLYERLQDLFEHKNESSKKHPEKRLCP